MLETGEAVEGSYFWRDPNVPDYLRPAQTSTSNLKTLVFSSSGVSADVLNITLSNRKALKCFVYETMVHSREFPIRGA